MSKFEFTQVKQQLIKYLSQYNNNKSIFQRHFWSNNSNNSKYATSQLYSMNRTYDLIRNAARCSFNPLTANPNQNNGALLIKPFSFTLDYAVLMVRRF